jgi:hypothetical protein
MPGYLSLTLRDGYGRETSKRLEFQDQVLLADYVLNANAMITSLNAITDLEIVRASMVLQDGLSLPAKDPAGSNVDVGATFVGEIEGGGGKKASHKVPGIKMAKVGAQGTIDVTDVDVAGYLNHFVDGSTDDFYVSDGEEIDVWLAGSLDK